jgi:hypothetical protein
LDPRNVQEISGRDFTTFHDSSHATILSFRYTSDENTRRLTAEQLWETAREETGSRELLPTP